MSALDRLDEIMARAKKAEEEMYDDSTRTAYTVTGEDVPDMVEALRAALNRCADVSATYKRTSEFDRGAILLAQIIHYEITSALEADRKP